jgi:hypothetical protein
MRTITGGQNGYRDVFSGGVYASGCGDGLDNVGLTTGERQ